MIQAHRMGQQGPGQEERTGFPVPEALATRVSVKREVSAEKAWSPGCQCCKQLPHPEQGQEDFPEQPENRGNDLLLILEWREKCAGRGWVTPYNWNRCRKPHLRVEVRIGLAGFVPHRFEEGKCGRRVYLLILQMLDSERPSSLSVSTLSSARLHIACLLIPALSRAWPWVSLAELITDKPLWGALHLPALEPILQPFGTVDLWRTDPQTAVGQPLSSLLGT